LEFFFNVVVTELNIFNVFFPCIFLIVIITPPTILFYLFIVRLRIG
jgi:hypothetical protein